MSGVYLADTPITAGLAGTCGLVNDDHLKYTRTRIERHPYAGAQCKQAALAKIDALCLAGMLTDELLEAILQEFDNNYTTGVCNTTGGSSTGTTNQPQCPDGYVYDAVRSLCVEQRTTITAETNWFGDNWPWLTLIGLGIVFLLITTGRKR